MSQSNYPMSQMRRVRGDNELAFPHRMKPRRRCPYWSRSLQPPLRMSRRLSQPASARPRCCESPEGEARATVPRDWTESEPPEAASACRALDSCGGRERADEWRSQGVWLNLRGSDSHDTVAESFQWRRRGGGWHAVRAWVCESGWRGAGGRKGARARRGGVR